MTTPVPEIMTSTTHDRRHQAGVGLIEVLVALAILGVVVLGFVAMQMRAVNMTGESYARTQAMSIAQDLVERMSINFSQTDAYLLPYKGGSVVAAETALDTSCVSAACNSAAIAASDLAQIRYYAGMLLPEGQVFLRRDDGNTNNIQVIVAWGGTSPVPGAANNSCMSKTGNDLQIKVDANCVMIESPLVEVN